MKSQSLKASPEKSNPRPLDRNAIILHEQLALKRLKELHAEGVLIHSPVEVHLSRARKGWQTLGAAVRILFRRVELSREVEPGKPPIPWREVDRLRHERAMRML